MAKPFVSVLTPTYNRRKFIPAAIECYKQQTYPKDRMEWVILDDGTDKVEDLFAEASKTIPNIVYIKNDEKLLIGQKRNLLNQHAKGDILVAMDDDDFYPPDRVSHAVQKFAQNPRIDLAGSSEMYLYFRTDGRIVKAGPYGPNHCTNGTMCYRRRYMLTHKYDETQTHAEEKSFLEDYKNPMIQLDPLKCILVMCHSDNTFDKTTIRNSSNPLLKETDMKIRNIIKDKGLRDFYTAC
jgi:glycosyltransferase involved in cell wall biosynthesis